MYNWALNCIAWKAGSWTVSLHVQMGAQKHPWMDGWEPNCTAGLTLHEGATEGVLIAWIVWRGSRMQIIYYRCWNEIYKCKLNVWRRIRGVLVGFRAFQLRSNVAFQTTQSEEWNVRPASPKIRLATCKLTSPSTQNSWGSSCLTSHDSGSTQGKAVGCIYRQDYLY